MSERLELTLSNRRTDVSRLQDRLEAFARDRGLPDAVLHAVQLALEEHLSNILSHAFDDARPHAIRVGLRVGSGVVEVRVEDDGRPFNPLDYPAPDLSRSMAERAVGGLGIYMMRNALDHLVYRRENGNNILVMRKRLPAG